MTIREERDAMLANLKNNLVQETRPSVLLPALGKAFLHEEGIAVAYEFLREKIFFSLSKNDFLGWL